MQNAVGSGFSFGYFDEDRSFVPLGSTQETAITMIKDWNMYLVGGKYQTDAVSGAEVVGCYHVRLAETYPDFPSAKAAADAYEDGFPAYHEDAWYVCVGSYTGQSAGAAAAESRGLNGTSMTCSNRCVTVVATGTVHILFQFDCGERRSLAVMPTAEEGEKATTWFKGYRYYGGFQYQRIDGKDMNVVNFLSMDDYIKGVIPYEMNAAWPLEALKAQAVAARTYTAAHLNHHNGSGFDLCCEVDCQTYRGVNASDENSDRAVDETSGVYMTYEGEYVNAFYFSSDGGATEDCENVFNAPLPYLRGKPDPYEAYVQTGRENWRFVYSADEITAILRMKNYRCAQIVSITPTYTSMGNIYSLKFTDANGVNWVFSKDRAGSILYSSAYQKYTYSQRFTVTDADAPADENSFYVDNEKAHAYYGEYVGEELLDITRNIFPLSDKREDTYIAGFSMGGYGAIRNGLKYSDNFSKIGMISPALITDDIADYTSDDNVLRSRQFYESIFGDLGTLKGSDKDPKALIESCRNIPDIYMACGEDDFLFEKARDFNEFLKGRNVNATFIEAPGEHTWEFCDKYIKEFIKTL